MHQLLIEAENDPFFSLKIHIACTGSTHVNHMRTKFLAASSTTALMLSFSHSLLD